MSNKIKSDHTQLSAQFKFLLINSLRTNRKIKSQNSTYMRGGANHRASSDSRCTVEVHPGL